MEYWITAESFGAELPENWESIAYYLNGIIDDRGIQEDHDAVNDLWEAYWAGEIPAPIVSDRRYGDSPTRLHLTEKAKTYYNETDPISIYECEAADGSLLYILDDGTASEPMTESELNECLESAYDETKGE